MNFEQLRLQIHMRDLFDRLGAMDAELMIVDAFLKEQARHERIHQPQAATSNHAVPTKSTHLCDTNTCGCAVDDSSSLQVA
jgi:hypothetical protein